MEVDLFNHAMKGDWKKVVELYKAHPEVHESKITKSGDTALHLAVSDGQEDYVRLLVAIIRDEENKQAGEQPQPLVPAPTPAALRVQNEKGNTPLHLAAALGSFEMCYCFASKYPDLIGIRNKEQKNPLFMAAQYGKKDVFLCLDNILSDNDKDKKKRESYYRGSNGDTFLHAAMNGEYFDLAFQIICRYEDLFNYFNEKGLTPLHILATKPSSFKSGSRLSRLDKIIYHCTHVDELEKNDVTEKMEKEEKKVTKLEQKLKKQKDHKKDLEVELILKPKLNLPENYKICFDIFGLVRTVVGVLLPKKEGLLIPKKKEEQPDVESQVPKKEDQLTQKKKEGPQEQPDMKSQVPKKEDKAESRVQAHHVFPPNYKSCVDIVKFIYKAVLIILGSGSRDIKKVQDKKHQHIYTGQMLKKLLPSTSQFGYDDNGMKPHSKVMGGAPLHQSDGISESTPPTTQDSSNASEKQKKEGDGEKKEATDPNAQKNEKLKILSNILLCLEGEKKEATDPDAHKNETPLLVAAKYGVMEIVKKVLELLPVAIHDVNSDGKNIVLLAVENRQPHVYKFLLEKETIMKDSIFSKVDKDGNSAVHLAAKIGEYRPWIIPGAALQMQWEIKWYEFVKYSMPLHFFVHYNNKNQTPKDIFTSTHTDLVKQGGEWLTKTSESCSVVAALIAAVAFATASTVPGGSNDKGKPHLEDNPVFNIFAVSSLFALCFSVTALVMFLAILTSRHQERDFRDSLPRKLLFGLTSLFLSIASMLISFCAGHFFVLKDKLQFVAIPAYAVTCLPVITFFAIAQFPLYIDLMWAMFKTVPSRSHRVVAQDEPKPAGMK